MRNIADLPFAHDHVVMLPDAHPGYAMPIGGVLAADGHVVPYAIGVDIGIRCAAPHPRDAEISADRGRDKPSRAGIAAVPEYLRRLCIGLTGLHHRDLVFDMSVGLEQIFPAIEIDIEEKQSKR